MTALIACNGLLPSYVKCLSNLQMGCGMLQYLWCIWSNNLNHLLSTMQIVTLLRVCLCSVQAIDCCKVIMYDTDVIIKRKKNKNTATLIYHRNVYTSTLRLMFLKIHT